MTTLIIVPVLNRPHRVRPLMRNISDATPEPHQVLFVADPDDRDEIAALRDNGAVWSEPGGTYPRKINWAYRMTTDPFLFLAADDVVFHEGWLTAALNKMQPGINVVGTNDGGIKPEVREGTHSVHTLVRRTYCDNPGATADDTNVVLHEGYRHCYVDDELCGVARKRGCYAHAHNSLVEHRHPYAQRGVTLDATYLKGRAYIPADKKVIAQRRGLWT